MMTSFSILVYIALLILHSTINAQPEERIYFFDFNGLSNWTILNNGHGINIAATDTTACETGRCWAMRGSSMATVIVSTSGYHTIRVEIDTTEYSLDKDEWCFIQYTTANIGWSPTYGLLTKNGYKRINVPLFIPDTTDYNNEPTFQIGIGNNGGDSSDLCFYDNLEVFGIPYTDNPTINPSNNPTPAPTNDPTPAPTNNPTPSPTNNPTLLPTKQPTLIPTFNPTPAPTNNPTPSPTDDPTPTPTSNPTKQTQPPTNNPTKDPTIDPTADPTNDPTKDPTKDPTNDPTDDPTVDPTTDPTYNPSKSPTPAPILYVGKQSTTKHPTMSPATNSIKQQQTNNPETNSNSENAQNIMDNADGLDIGIIIGILLGSLCLICIGIGIFCGYKKWHKETDKTVTIIISAKENKQKRQENIYNNTGFERALSASHELQKVIPSPSVSPKGRGEGKQSMIEMSNNPILTPTSKDINNDNEKVERFMDDESDRSSNDGEGVLITTGNINNDENENGDTDTGSDVNDNDNDNDIITDIEVIKGDNNYKETRHPNIKDDEFIVDNESNKGIITDGNNIETDENDTDENDTDDDVLTDDMHITAGGPNDGHIMVQKQYNNDDIVNNEDNEGTDDDDILSDEIDITAGNPNNVINHGFIDDNMAINMAMFMNDITDVKNNNNDTNDSDDEILDGIDTMQ